MQSRTGPRNPLSRTRLQLRELFSTAVILVSVFLACFVANAQSREARTDPGNAGQGSGPHAESPEETLVRHLHRFAEPLFLEMATFSRSLRVSFKGLPPLNEPRVEGTPKKTSGGEVHELLVGRSGHEGCFLHLTSPWKNVHIVREEGRTFIALPQQGVSFEGSGPVATPSDSLFPAGFLGRLVTMETQLFSFLAILGPSTFDTGLKQLLLPRLSRIPSTASGTLSWELPGHDTISLFPGTPSRIRFEVASSSRGIKGLRFFELSEGPPPPDSFLSSEGARLRAVSVSRDDLEKLVFRGIKRFLSIEFPGPAILGKPASAKTENGELRLNGEDLLLMLWGTPLQMGTAHGRLLGPMVTRTVDSTIYLVGLAETVGRGRWFLGDLDGAWDRLSPHIPPDHLTELAAIASQCPGLSWREARLASIFPEYFHCSGFALFGRATKDGVLYHGRVLDYMTEIGLQQSAVTFVMKPRAKNAFVNPGFAGFTGSVSGMNEKQIALGEMGGGGRFKWDGVPMAALMRKALEECDTLAQVKQLWASSPRTCEYYYVFSDGKIPDAVAVKAVPEAVEFLGPGQPHPLLGEGITDAVVISAGKRLELLRKRVREGHGTFDAQSALHLMDRPVAMESNLHDVLFLPQSLEVFVAVAGPHQPAAERPYAHFDFKALLREIP